MAQKTYPDFFAEAGQTASSEFEEVQRALRQVEIVRQLLPSEVQIDFEKADLLGNEEFFSKNWSSYKYGLVYHALASFGTLFWTKFRHWLKKMSDTDKSARDALDLFNDHPAFNQVMDILIYQLENLSQFLCGNLV